MNYDITPHQRKLVDDLIYLSMMAGTSDFTVTGLKRGLDTIIKKCQDDIAEHNAKLIHKQDDVRIQNHRDQADGLRSMVAGLQEDFKTNI